MKDFFRTVCKTGNTDIDRTAKYASDAFDAYRHCMEHGDEAGASLMLALAMETLGLDGFGVDAQSTSSGAGNDDPGCWLD